MVRVYAVYVLSRLGHFFLDCCIAFVVRCLEWGFEDVARKYPKFID